MHVRFRTVLPHDIEAGEIIIPTMRSLRLLLAYCVFSSAICGLAEAKPDTLQALRELTSKRNRAHPSEVSTILISSEDIRTEITIIKNAKAEKKHARSVSVIRWLSPFIRTYYSFYSDRLDAFVVYNPDTNSFCRTGSPSQLEADGRFVSALINGDMLAAFPDAVSAVAQTPAGFRLEVSLPATALLHAAGDPVVASMSPARDAEQVTYSFEFLDDGTLISSSSLVGDRFIHAKASHSPQSPSEAKKMIDGVLSNAAALHSATELSPADFFAPKKPEAKSF